MPYLLIALSFASIVLPYIEQSNFTHAVISLLVLIATYRNSFRFFLSYLILLLFLIFSGLANTQIDAIRSATPIATLLPIFLILRPYLKIDSNLKCQKDACVWVTWLYIIGGVQVLLYLLQISQSGNYYFLKSLSEQNRINVGWVAIVSFFAALINIGEPHVADLKPIGKIIRVILIIVVPLLVFLNSSRSEKVVVILFSGISLIRYVMRNNNIGSSIVSLIGGVSFFIAINYDFLGDDLLRSSDEFAFVDLTDVGAIHGSFRSYETKLLIERLMANRWNWLFGHGFGAGVEMDTGVNINGRIYSSIAVFHNGFLGYLLQTGLFGLVIFIKIFIETARIAFNILVARKNNLSMFWVLYSGANMILIFTSATTGGFASSPDVHMLVTVYAFCMLIARRSVGLK